MKVNKTQVTTPLFGNGTTNGNLASAGGAPLFGASVFSSSGSSSTASSGSSSGGGCSSICIA